jgi:hypothetical protein
MNKLRLLFASYVLILVGFFVYSFTQVDLNLTLSKVSFFQTAEKSLQYVGFFQRPISTIIFIIIVGLLFIAYVLFLFLAKKGKLSPHHLVVLTIASFITLVFSYNAFSYDLFNYIFDAKILTHYHLNPYAHSAGDFFNDPMLNFMRWTHRTYPYGASWLLLTIPLSLLGFGIFLPTFFLLKILMGLSFLGSCFLIYKISQKIFPKQAIFNTAFFAFNPLVLTESLISAHNDMPMIFFFLLSIWLFLQKKKVLGWVSNIFSIGIKFSTGVLLPLMFVLEFFNITKRKISWEKFFVTAVALSLLTVLLATIRTNFQPWYLVFPLAMAAFVPKKMYIFIPSIIATIFAVSVYIPYVFMTDYAKGYPLIVQNIEIVGLVVFVISIFVSPLIVKIFSKR